MTRTTQLLPPSDEEGFALIEVLVSALVIALVGAAVLTALQATARSAADSRNHAAAQAIAQEDQARLRSMRISSLNRLEQTWPVTLGGTTFTVKSTGTFINNTSGTASCTGGNVSADYVRITSTVTWPTLKGRPPVVLQSIVSPSNGSLDPGHGTLTVSTINAAGLPLPGVALSGSGGGTFSGTTDASGCANFADLAAGNYTLTPTAAGLVDKDGKAPAALATSVPPSGTNTVQLQYDHPGALEVNFKYRVGSSGEFKTSSASSVRVFNSTMTSPLTVSAPGGNPATTITTPTSPAKLFPFTAPYAVYAGTCSENNPNPKSEPGAPGAAAVASVTVPPGAATAPLPKGSIQLPALNVVVKKNGTPLVGAKVKVTGTCSFSRNFTTVEGGVLPDQGLPWGTYNVCISGPNTSGSTRRTEPSNVAVQNLAAATTISVDTNSMNSGSSCF